VVAALALAACGSAPSVGVGTLESVRLAGVEEELRSGTWRSGYSGSTVWHWETLRFVAPDRVELRRGHDPHGAPAEERASEAAPTLGRYRVTPSGALEMELAGRTQSATFVAAHAAGGARVWAGWGFVASSRSPRSYWHEHASRGGPGEPGSDVRAELTFDSPLEALSPGAPCRARLRVEARVLEGATETERASLALSLACRLEVVDGRRLLVFADLPTPARDIDAGSDWSNWLAREGHRTWSGAAMSDAMAAAFVSTFVVDPARPGVLHGVYVAGRQLDTEVPPGTE